ncbi:MAG: hypothetical protein IJO11_01775, partial [Alphaproteobacteria bacterium]|nr:hypothetical protein [Alphaproteobacteria bacterium]
PKMGGTDKSNCVACTSTGDIAGSIQEACTRCVERYWSNTGICLYCENNDVDTSIIKSQCHRCDNRYWVETTGATEDVDALGNCHHCNNTSTISKSTKAECYRCENRYWVETKVATENTVALGDCYVCPTGMTRDEKTGVCACGENELYDRYNKKCVSCPDTTSGVLSTEQASETSCPMIRYYSNDTYSYSCSVATQNPTTTKENCLFCGKDVRFWKGKNLYCYNCLDTDEVTETERSECEVCSKRYWAETTAATETVEALGTCYPCPTGMSRDSKSGICGCDKGKIYSRTSKSCVSCMENSNFLSTEQSTEILCPDIRYYSTNGNSYLCSRTDQYPETTKENCAFCGEGIRFWREYYKTCWNCDYTSEVSYVKETDCEVCPKRYWVEHDVTNHYGYCYLCPTGMVRDKKTGLCTCAEDEVYDYGNNKCVSCTENANFKSTEKGTETSCPAIRYYSTNGYSYLCSRTDQYNIPTTKENCEFCGKNVRFWRDSDDYCIHCDRTDKWDNTTESQCERCTERYWIETKAATETSDALGACYHCPTGMTRDEKTGICVCEEGTIFSRSSNTCVPCDQAGEFLSTEQSTETSCSGERYYATNGYSYICTRIDQAPETTKENCAFCGEKDGRFWREYYKTCWSCNDNETVSWTKESDCEVCSNRYWVEHDATNHYGYCYLCPNGMKRDEKTGICACEEGFVYNRSTNICVSCEQTDRFVSTAESSSNSCAGIRYYANDTYSYLCSATTCAATTRENCVVCGEKNVRFWQSGNNNCVSCNHSYTDTTTQEECHMCDNRYWRTDNHCFNCDTNDYQSGLSADECYRCPNRFWRSNDNYCIHCNHTTTHGTTLRNECEVCPNRYWVEKNTTTHTGDCYICPTGMVRDNDTGTCVCEEGKIINNSNNTCVECTLTTGFKTTQEDNDTYCKGIRYFASDNASYLCSLTAEYKVTTKENCAFCGADVRFWRDSDDLCIHCNYGPETNATQEECHTCSNRFWRNTGSNQCMNCNTLTYYNSVTQDECYRCENWFWRGSSSQCVHCDRTDSWDNTTKTECSRCENRYWVEHDATNHLGYCYKCPAGTVANSDHTGCQA